MNRVRKRAFTLVEILAVIAIIMMIAAIAVPTTSGLFRGFELTQAAEMVTSQISMARQTALSSNQVVEVRFYKYADSETPGNVANFRALQIFKIPQSSVGPTALTSVQRLPHSVVIDGGSTLSSLLDSTVRTSRTGDVSLPRVGMNYSYYSFRFHPDGSTDLSLSLPVASPGCWFLTLHSEKDGDNRATPPANYATIQLDPVNGTTRLFRR